MAHGKALLAGLTLFFVGGAFGQVQVLSHHMISDEQRASLVEFAEDIIALLNRGSNTGDDVRDGRGRGRERRPRTATSEESFPGVSGFD